MATEQKVFQLSEIDSLVLDQMRGFIERFLVDGNENRAKYETVSGKLSFLKTLLEHQVFPPADAYPHHCMGIVFGDALVKHCGMEWRMVVDENGTDPCLELPRVTMLLFPMTTISKRVEKRVSFDVFEMFNGVVTRIDDLKVKSGIRTLNFLHN